MIQPDDKLKFVHLEYLARFGTPNGYFSFKSEIKDDTVPPEIVVFYWSDFGEDKSTLFCTLGMCSIKMEDDNSSELFFTVKRKLDADDIMAFCRFFADMALYPFIHEFALDWWNLIIGVGRVPLYKDSGAVLVQPDFFNEKFCDIEMGDEIIKFFNIVPLTEEESDMVQKEGVVKLLDYIEENKIDVFEIR